MRVSRRFAPVVGLLAALLAFGAFAAQAVTICDVQAFDAAGFSPLNGEAVVVTGVVTLPNGYIVPGLDYTSMYVEDEGCGVNVFCPAPLGYQLRPGDVVEISGEVEEYISDNGSGSVTEIFCPSPSQIRLISTGNPEPEPFEANLGDLVNEAYEGRLVRTVGVVTSASSFQIFLDDLSDPLIYQGYNDSVNFTLVDIGDTIDVTGVIAQYDPSPPYLSGYEIIPRFQRDIKSYSSPQEPFVGFSNDVEISFRMITGSDSSSVAVTSDEMSPVFYPDVGEILPIYYRTREGDDVKLEIYDLQGRLVRTLVTGAYDGYSELPSYYEVIFPYQIGVRGWDGRDDLRRLMRVGTYVCRLEAKDADGDVSTAVAPIVVGAKLDR